MKTLILKKQSQKFKLILKKHNFKNLKAVHANTIL